MDFLLFWGWSSIESLVDSHSGTIVFAETVSCFCLPVVFLYIYTHIYDNMYVYMYILYIFRVYIYISLSHYCWLCIYIYITFKACFHGRSMFPFFWLFFITLLSSPPEVALGDIP